MNISKTERPEKFEHPTGLVYYARRITDEERNAPIVVPSKQEYENLCGYEPKIGVYSNWNYEAWAENYKVQSQKELDTLRACTYTIVSAAIQRRHWEEQIAEIESRKEFEGWLV